jgi:hypothetical protein
LLDILLQQKNSTLFRKSNVIKKDETTVNQQRRNLTRIHVPLLSSVKKKILLQIIGSKHLKQLELTSQETQNPKQQNALTQLKTFLPALFTPHCTLHTFAIASCPQTKDLLKNLFSYISMCKQIYQTHHHLQGEMGACCIVRNTLQYK